MCKTFKIILKSILPKPVLDFRTSLYFALKKYQFKLFGRPYMPAETTKAKKRRLKEHFFAKYCKGKGLDIGFGGDPIIDGVDVFDYEHGDAQYLTNVQDNQYDFVYSSHTLEHMCDLEITLKNWWRTLKPGGYLIIYIPHRDLYERKNTLPSNFNPDHKHYFLLDTNELPCTVGIVPLINRILPNSEVIYAKICNQNYSININNTCSGEYSIEVIAKKL